GKRMRRVSSNAQSEIGNFASLLNQAFQGARHVKAYGMEMYENSRVQKVTESIFKLMVKGYRTSAVTNPVSELLSGAAMVGVIVYGGIRVIDGISTPGELFSFVTAFLLAYDPIKRMAKMNGQYQSGLAAADRIFALMDTKPHIVDGP